MLNCAIIMGRITADPELRKTPNGTSVTSFNVAVERSFVRAGEERQTDFIHVVAWQKTAEFITKYFSKGWMIAVQGSIQTRNYEDKKGNKQTAVELVADNVSFCGSKNDMCKSVHSTTSERYTPIDTAGKYDVVDDCDDELPF